MPHRVADHLGEDQLRIGDHLGRQAVVPQVGDQTAARDVALAAACGSATAAMSPPPPRLLDPPTIL